jgi:hypothetical protein
MILSLDTGQWQQAVAPSQLHDHEDKQGTLQCAVWLSSGGQQARHNKCIFDLRYFQFRMGLSGCSSIMKQRAS